MKKLLLLFTTIILLTPFLLKAATVITETDVNLGADQIYSENLYIGAGKTNISSNIESDLTIVSGESVISGKVSGDIFVAGGNLQFNGQASGDLRIIGGQVSVAGKVDGDLLIIGGQVFVSKDAILSSDILLVGGEINFEAEAPANLKIVAGKVFINSNLIGKSEITTQSLVLGPSSIVSGVLSYYSPIKLHQESGSQISGTVNFNQINSIKDTSLIKKTIVNFLNFWLLLRFITTLILAFILVYVFKVFATEVNKITCNSFWKSILAGVLTILLMPILILSLIVSLFALPIGFLLLLGFIFTLIISPAVVGIVIGSWLKKRFKKDIEYTVDFNTAAIGVVIYTLLQFVPFIGGLIRTILLVTVLGSIVRYLRVSIFK